jgi:hypothetical protein
LTGTYIGIVTVCVTLVTSYPLLSVRYPSVSDHRYPAVIEHGTNRATARLSPVGSALGSTKFCNSINHNTYIRVRPHGIISTRPYVAAGRPNAGRSTERTNGTPPIE